jgi:hypothetical protein
LKRGRPSLVTAPIHSQHRVLILVSLGGNGPSRSTRLQNISDARRSSSLFVICRRGRGPRFLWGFGIRATLTQVLQETWASGRRSDIPAGPTSLSPSLQVVHKASVTFGPYMAGRGCMQRGQAVLDRYEAGITVHLGCSDAQFSVARCKNHSTASSSSSRSGFNLHRPQLFNIGQTLRCVAGKPHDRCGCHGSRPKLSHCQAA